MAATKETRRSTVVAVVLVMMLAVAACLPTLVAASAIPAGGAHPLHFLPPATPERTVGDGGGGSVAATVHIGGAAAVASVPNTLRQDFVPLSAVECRSTARYLAKAKRALADADCIDKADQATRLQLLLAAISVLRAAAKRSPAGIQGNEVEAVAAAVSKADPQYVCVIATSTTDVGQTYSDFGVGQGYSDTREDPFDGGHNLRGSNVVVTSSTATCCPEWAEYDGKCCFMSCFHMADLFPALLTIDDCCRQPHNTCEPTHSCPNHVVYAVAP